MVTVYLDNCALHRPNDSRSVARNVVEAEAVLRLIELHEAGVISIVGSGPLIFGAMRNPDEERRREMLDFLASTARLSPDGNDVVESAARFGAEGLRAMDAMHLATAVEAAVDYSCTCDDAFLRRARRVDTRSTMVVSPLELVLELA